MHLLFLLNLEDFVKTDFVEMLKNKFNELNLGSIKKVEKIPYIYDPKSLAKSLNSLEETIAKHAKDSLMTIIIPSEKRDRFYSSAKTKASEMEYHTQLIETNTIKRIKEEKGSGLLTNICGRIYVEFLIQKKIFEGNLAGPLTWKLHSPADGKARAQNLRMFLIRALSQISLTPNPIALK
jgi:hypothetical protein